MCFFVAAPAGLRLQKKKAVLFFKRKKKIEELPAEPIEWFFLFYVMYVDKVDGIDCSLQLNDLDYFPESPKYYLFYHNQSPSLKALPTCWLFPEQVSVPSNQPKRTALILEFPKLLDHWQKRIDPLMVEGLNAFVAFLKEEGLSQETLSFFEAAMPRVVHLLQVAKLKDDAAGALVKKAISSVNTKTGDPLSRLEGLFAIVLNKYESQCINSPIAAAQWYFEFALLYVFQSSEDAEHFYIQAILLDPSLTDAVQLRSWLVYDVAKLE